MRAAAFYLACVHDEELTLFSGIEQNVTKVEQRSVQAVAERRGFSRKRHLDTRQNIVLLVGIMGGDARVAHEHKRRTGI